MSATILLVLFIIIIIVFFTAIKVIIKNHHYHHPQGAGGPGHRGQPSCHGGHTWPQEGQEVMMFIMMIVVVMIMLTAYTQNTYGPNTNRYIFRFLRWSLGLIFHQCWVDCARALLLVPLGRSLLLCAPVNIISNIFIIIIVIIMISYHHIDIICFIFYT